MQWGCRDEEAGRWLGGVLRAASAWHAAHTRSRALGAYHAPPGASCRAGSALLLAGAEGATGRQLDRDVEELVTAFGQAFMVLLGIWIFTHDLEWLGKALVHTGMQPPPPAPPLP